MSNPLRKQKLHVEPGAVRWVDDIPPTPRDPYAVPDSLRAAYDAATPDPYVHFDDASTEVASERFPNTVITPQLRAEVQKDHIAEVLKRAEHLSRLSQARNAAREAEWKAEHNARREKEGRCPVCGELNPPVTRRTGEHLPKDGWRACIACDETARALWSDAQRTQARVRAVKAALSL